MNTVEVSTVVYLPPEEVFDFVVDFPRYAAYSKYLRDVRADGPGGAGTTYDLEFAWWKLSYTARSRVTAVERPRRVEWKLVKDIEASGYWALEEEPSAAPPDRETATRVTLRVDFRPETADESALSLPRFVSLDWVLARVVPKIEREAERVVRRAVADLEGEPREVELEVRQAPNEL